ncbi:glycerol dehydrogenase [Xanthobacter oligotrophicus]|uniref:glycerol dehydrogenase n=1 Tax=Xanthobacter oligotrophicus TaxID=2607286 RepID=UPI0011F17094|nr:glycerol dehydrogenase [Xanthobacter oligotrophicus]MCG5235095.1 glycerol dehydrogenase [Xanthobacter oligotrophicus]
MKVFGAPRRYVQGKGALDHLGPELARLTDSAALVIDPFIDDLFGDHLQASCRAAGVNLVRLRFGGESSPSEIDRLRAALGDTPPPLVAAAGGGKCIDAGKALANRIGAKVATIPTIASTDAPTSHNYVLYDDDHRLLAVEKLPANPDLVLVDTQVIAEAPRQLFLAGIGDAVVKLFEVERCVAAKGRNVFGADPAFSALILARGCYDVLRRHAPAALAAVDRKEADDALDLVVEATVLMSGLSFESGGLSIAHSMTRGLSAVPKYARALHGLEVAYGVLVQLVLEGRDANFFADLLGFYNATGLPTSLTALAGAAPTPEEADTIARLTLSAPHARHFPRVLEEAEVVRAILAIEAGRFADALVEDAMQGSKSPSTAPALAV